MDLRRLIADLADRTDVGAGDGIDVYLNDGSIPLAKPALVSGLYQEFSSVSGKTIGIDPSFQGLGPGEPKDIVLDKGKSVLVSGLTGGVIDPDVYPQSDVTEILVQYVDIVLNVARIDAAGKPLVIPEEVTAEFGVFLGTTL